ncbi:MAG: hypothetical protein IJ567_09470 [Lachnospiraceae bacterium]|nr:hypothetical protein [Lachnospiraceae bacterium]
MSLTNEKMRLQEYACDSKANIFTEIDTEADTYWEDEKEQNALMQIYGFETPLELMNGLKMYINDDLNKIITAACFKNQHVVMDTASNDNDAQNQLPEYVYNF